MKKLLLILASLFLLAASAEAATVTHRVSTASTTDGTSFASDAFTPAAGDVLVAFVTATGTVAAGSMTDSQNLGWDKITSALKASSADTLYLFVSRGTTANSSMTVTFDCTGDSATGAVIQVASVSGMSRVGAVAVRQSQVVSNHASGTPAPAFASSALTGNPTLGLIGNATNPATMTAPTNWSEANDTGFATPTTGAEYVFRNSGFTGTTITWGSSSASAYGAIIVELDTTSTPSAPAVPAFVQSKNHAELLQTGVGTTSTWQITLPNPSGAGNLLLAGGTWGDAAVTASIADDKSNTWTCPAPAQDGGMGASGTICFAPNAASGTRVITITLSSAVYFTKFGASEWRNVATSNALDGSHAAVTGSGTTVAAGAFNTTNNGDLICQYAALDNWSGISAPIGWSAGSPLALVTADGASFDAVQCGVQSTHGSINPTLTVGTSILGAVTSAIALKPASAGTSPAAGIRVQSIQAINMPEYSGFTTGSFTLNFPSSGNLPAISWNGPTASYPTSITSANPSCSWTSAPSKADDTNGYSIWFWYAPNCSLTSTFTVTVTYAGAIGATAPALLVFYDVAGANTAPYDTYGNNNGNQTVWSSTITGASITPSTANGVVLSMINQVWDTSVGVNTGYFDAAWTGIYQLYYVDQDSGFAHYYNPDTSAITFIWTLSETSGQAAGKWMTQAIAFKAPGGGPASPHQLPTMGCCL